MAKVSIVLPSYNHGRFLEKRLESILKQTFTDWELIIIDDCSSDNSITILNNFVNKYERKVVHFILNETNSGSGYNSWKRGIELADAEYIWIAETDDYAALEFLEEQVRVLDSDINISLSFSASNYVDKNNFFLYNSDKRAEDLQIKEDDFGIFDFSHFIKKTPFNTYITNGSSVVFRNPKKKMPNEIFSLKQTSDQFLWTYLIREGCFAFLNKKINYFRQHKGSTTQKNTKENNGSLYIEVANYLNFFNLSYKYEAFVDHYIKHFVWKNKIKFFSTRVICQVKNVKKAKQIYYSKLFHFILNKVFVRNVK